MEEKKNLYSLFTINNFKTHYEKYLFEIFLEVFIFQKKRKKLDLHLCRHSKPYLKPEFPTAVDGKAYSRGKQQRFVLIGWLDGRLE